MEPPVKTTSYVLAALAVSGCALLPRVHQEDLDAWVGIPVDRLDFHPLFMPMPMTSRTTQNGVEIRVYRNSKANSSCSINYGKVSCDSDEVTCNNVFFVKDGAVIEYRPVGRCKTDLSTRP